MLPWTVDSRRPRHGKIPQYESPELSSVTPYCFLVRRMSTTTWRVLSRAQLPTPAVSLEAPHTAPPHPHPSLHDPVPSHSDGKSTGLDAQMTPQVQGRSQDRKAIQADCKVTQAPITSLYSLCDCKCSRNVKCLNQGTGGVGLARCRGVCKLRILHFFAAFWVCRDRVAFRRLGLCSFHHMGMERDWAMGLRGVCPPVLSP